MAAFTKWNGQTLVFQPMAPIFEFFDPAAYYVECPESYRHHNFDPVVEVAPRWFYHREANVLSPYKDVHYETVIDDEWRRRTLEFSVPVVTRDWKRLQPFWWKW